MAVVTLVWWLHQHVNSNWMRFSRVRVEAFRFGQGREAEAVAA